jgi:hypothetical protein
LGHRSLRANVPEIISVQTTFVQTGIWERRLCGVEQTLATKPGKEYRVTFHMSGNPGAPEHKKVQLGVRAAGQDKEFELSMEGRTYKDLKWEELTWELVAKEKSTTIEFHTAMPATNAFGGPLLDDVKVVEIN